MSWKTEGSAMTSAFFVCRDAQERRGPRWSSPCGRCPGRPSSPRRRCTPSPCRPSPARPADRRSSSDGRSTSSPAACPGRLEEEPTSDDESPDTRRSRRIVGLIETPFTPQCHLDLFLPTPHLTGGSGWPTRPPAADTAGRCTWTRGAWRHGGLEPGRSQVVDGDR